MRELFAPNIYHESTNPKQQKLIYKSTFSFYLKKKKIEDYTGNLTRIASVQFKKSEIIGKFSLNFKTSYLQVYTNHKYQEITLSQNVYL